jgi:hypothetical protein
MTIAANSSEMVCPELTSVVARDLLLALSYGADGREHPSLAPDAEMSTDPVAWDLLRRSDWRFPDVEGCLVRFTSRSGYATIEFRFGPDGLIDRVRVWVPDPESADHFQVRA